GNCFSKRRAA
nr:Chain C, Apoptosis-inducing factor 3 [Homo sapiens]6QRM_D Chain D, Apoptosis-inducing factor 3 [Homo sapiens]